MASCQACGNECPAGAVFCAACGHRLGLQPADPINVTVRLIDAALRDCWSCSTTALAVLVLVVFAFWIFSC